MPGRSSAPGYEFLAPPEQPDEIGRLGGYRVLQLLGQGAMGMVFRAEDLGLGRIVALKVLPPTVASMAETRQRFLREARAATLVNHPNVIPIYKIGEDRGVPYLAMPLLKGELLETRLNRERRLPVRDAVRIASEVAKGLAAAHERNLIHRDIKPANLWLEATQRRSAAERVKILDLGLACKVGPGLPTSGAVLGTPAYMAPEQVRGLTVDYRCDLFSLGCVMYRMLTGERAFQGNEVFAVLMALTSVHPPPPHEVNPAVPVGVSQLVMRLLAKQPDDRPQSAAEVVAALSSMEQPGTAALSRNEPHYHAGSSAPVTVAISSADRPIMLPTPDEFAPRGDRRSPVLAALLVVVGLIVWGVFASPTVRHLLSIAIGVLLFGAGLVGMVAAWRLVRRKLARRETVPQPKASSVSKRNREDSFGLPPTSLNQPRVSNAADDGPTGTAILAGTASLPQVGAEANSSYRGHTDAVWSVAVSPDGTLALSGAMDHSVRLWNLQTLQEINCFDGHAEGITAVAFTPDGRLACSASLDGTVRLCLVPEGIELRRFAGHSGRVLGVACAPDGRSLASCGADGTVRLWDVESVGLRPALQGHAAWVYAVAYSGDRLLSAGADGTLRLWDAGTGVEVQRLEGHTAAVRCVAVSPDGTRAVSGGEDCTVILWDLAVGQPVRRLAGHTEWVRAVAWTPDGRRVVTGGDDETLCVWDSATGELLKRFEDTGGSVLCLVVTRDARFALAGSDDATVRRWELPSRQT
jgi:WD40 repeat protein